MSVVYFLVLVGVLVVIHEFGHFLAAKLLGFHVVRFSVGFGRPLLRIRGGETDYQLGLIPLGGYVRLSGEDPGDDVPADQAHRAWGAKPVWQRTLVVLAGPAANLVLPVLLYFVAFAGDHELPAAVIGDVLAGSPAARAGLESGDRIRSIDGDEVRYWEEIEERVADSHGRSLALAVERRGRPLVVELVPEVAAGRAQVGIVAAPFLPQIGVIDPGSPAGRAGLETGDRVTAIDGQPLASYGALERALAGPARRVNLTVLRGRATDALGVELFEPRHTSLVIDTAVTADGKRRAVHGVHPAALVLATVEPGSPAARAGLVVGDRLVSLDGDPLEHWLPLSRALAARGTEPARLGFLRGGEPVPREVTVRQSWRRADDEYGQRTSALWFGAAPRFVVGRAAQVAIDGRLGYAAGKAVERTVETIGAVASGMWSIVRGQSPEDELGGPITMFRVAAVSGAKGLEAFLLMLALVSVSVGLLNLLPVPILDGGHLLLFAIEGVRRRPLSPRTRDRVGWVGLALVGLITALALGNDVMRYVLG